MTDPMKCACCGNDADALIGVNVCHECEKEIAALKAENERLRMAIINDAVRPSDDRTSFKTVPEMLVHQLKQECEQYERERDELAAWKAALTKPNHWADQIRRVMARCRLCYGKVEYVGGDAERYVCVDCADLSKIADIITARENEIDALKAEVERLNGILKDQETLLLNAPDQRAANSGTLNPVVGKGE